MNRAWNLDLTKIFTDYNNDDLTYTVAMDGGEEETVEGTVYSFTPDAVGEHTLVFAAACAASELRAVYTVNLSVQEGVYEVRFSISYAGIDLPDATLTLRDANYQLVPHTQGNYNFMLRPGKYMYSVSMEGYEDVEQVIIKVVESDEPMVINVEMAPTQTVKYPVMFYLTDTDGNAVTGATVTVASLDYNNQKTTSMFLRKYVPGYENCRVKSSGSTLGVRETRRMHLHLHHPDERCRRIQALSHHHPRCHPEIRRGHLMPNTSFLSIGAGSYDGSISITQ